MKIAFVVVSLSALLACATSAFAGGRIKYVKYDCREYSSYTQNVGGEITPTGVELRSFTSNMPKSEIGWIEYIIGSHVFECNEDRPTWLLDGNVQCWGGLCNGR